MPRRGRAARLAGVLAREQGEGAAVYPPGRRALTTAFPLPANLVAAARSEGRDGWLETLPGTVAALAERWELDVEAPYQPGGVTAWVAPATCRQAGKQAGAGAGAGATGPTTPGEDRVVLKVLWRHADAVHEAEGLRAWDGAGAVRVYDTETIDDATEALLLEECRPGTMLRSRPEPEQDVVIAGLLRDLWIAPAEGAPFRSLEAMCKVWADEFEEKRAAGDVTLDPGIARAGIDLYRTLPNTAKRHVLLFTDLHAGNVLAAGRRPWLVIDPKPHVGDPTYDPLQHLLNCEDRLYADPQGLCHRLADLLDLDWERLVLWLFARCVQESPDRPSLRSLAERLAPA